MLLIIDSGNSLSLEQGRRAWAHYRVCTHKMHKNGKFCTAVMVGHQRPYLQIEELGHSKAESA